MMYNLNIALTVNRSNVVVAKAEKAISCEYGKYSPKSTETIGKVKVNKDLTTASATNKISNQFKGMVLTPALRTLAFSQTLDELQRINGGRELVIEVPAFVSEWLDGFND